MLAEGLGVPYYFAPAFVNRQRAAAVGTLGIRYYEAGRYESAAEFRPEYLRKSQAERERAEREENAVPQVRRMTKEDGAAVAEMEHQLFSDAWSEKSVLETLDQPNSICLIVEKAGRTAGYLLAYTAADEAEIARIAVMKEFQRQGRPVPFLRNWRPCALRTGSGGSCWMCAPATDRRESCMKKRDLRKTGSASGSMRIRWKTRFL